MPHVAVVGVNFGVTAFLEIMMDGYLLKILMRSLQGNVTGSRASTRHAANPDIQEEWDKAPNL